jgi:mono/diheme cytochrome c family protein
MRLCKPLLIFSLMTALLAGCSPAPESARGFSLPDGDPESGRQAFLDLQCHACHKLPGEELPAISIAAPVTVMLGGPVSRVKTYGELVTAIINPSHKLIRTYPKDEVSSGGQTFMPSMNEFMTVRQLVDIVSFLQDKYQVVLPTPYPYSIYRYSIVAPGGN